MTMSLNRVLHRAFRHSVHYLMILLSVWPWLAGFCGSPAIAAPIIPTDGWITPALRPAQPEVGAQRTVLIHVCDSQQDRPQGPSSVRRAKLVRGTHSDPRTVEGVSVSKMEQENHEVMKQYRPCAGKVEAMRPIHGASASRPECPAAMVSSPLAQEPGTRVRLVNGRNAQRCTGPAECVVIPPRPEMRRIADATADREGTSAGADPRA